VRRVAMRELKDLLWWITVSVALLVLIGVLIYEIWLAVRIGFILIDILS
jgi:hypothetical protein